MARMSPQPTLPRRRLGRVVFAVSCLLLAILACATPALSAPGRARAPGGAGAAGGAGGAARSSPTRTPLGPVAMRPVAYRAPILAGLSIVRRFEPPPTPYAAGHRGVDLAAPQGATVVAAGSGVVSFAGPVAGRGVVVIRHADGVSTEYEPVSPVVHRGQTVRAGAPVGAVSGRHAACGPASCLHWGARRGGAYFDPLSLLRPLGPVRLMPWTRGT